MPTQTEQPTTRKTDEELFTPELQAAIQADAELVKRLADERAALESDNAAFIATVEEGGMTAAAAMKQAGKLKERALALALLELERFGAREKRWTLLSSECREEADRLMYLVVARQDAIQAEFKDRIQTAHAMNELIYSDPECNGLRMQENHWRNRGQILRDRHAESLERAAIVERIRAAIA